MPAAGLEWDRRDREANDGTSMTPAELNLPMTLPGIAARAARLFGDAPAVIEAGRTLSFVELYCQVRCAASAFLANGIGKGDVVAIWAPNRHEWIVAALGAQITGAAITPLNTRLKGREAGDILRRARARLLLTVDSFLGIEYPALLRGQDLPSLQRRISFDGGKVLDGWTSFLAEGRGADDPAVDVALAGLAQSDVSDILFTSGTTGAPKGVVSEHGSVVSTFASWADVVGLQQADRYLVVNPFFHSFGYKAGWLVCLMKGATCLPMASFDIAALADLVETHRVTVLPGPPTIYQSLLSNPALCGRDLSSLRLAVTGAATVPPILVERMRQELGFSSISTGYGLTEAGVVTLCDPQDSAERISQTCGRAIPGVELRCIDEQGRELPAGQAGEVCVRGSCLMRGYLDDPVATAEAIDAEGWLHTGDIGVLDAEGYLRITDRKKDVYISGGFNCYPAEVEKLLAEHPQISMVAVVGVPDERMGEVGKAFVVPSAGAHLEASQVIAWARDNMANYKVPRFVAIVPELPTNASGKVLRMALRDI